MSSLISKYLRCLGLLLLASTLALPSMAAATAAEQIGMKLGGNKLEVLGKSHCTETGNVEFVLTSALQLKNDFQVLFKQVDKNTDVSKAKGDNLCPAKIAVGQKIQGSFTKASPNLPAKDLINARGSACQAGSGVSEAQVVCIYEGAGGSDELLAYALYRIETAVAKIKSIGDRTAVNGEVSFEIALEGQHGGDLMVETCFGETSLGDIDADKKICPNNFLVHKVSSTKVKIKDLKAVEYAFKVRLNNAKDGASDWSDSFKETPVPVLYPSDAYNGNGAEVGWSCAQSQGLGSWLVIAASLVGLLLLRARARANDLTKRPFRLGLPALAIVAIASALLFTKSANAETGQVSIGILGSMYRPDLDNEVMANGEKIFPFYKNFYRKKTSDANGPITPFMGGEVDLHVVDGIGSLRAGLGFGYTYVSGHALKLDKEGRPNADEQVSGASASLHMYQLRPQLTYAFDYFANAFPLVPYIKAALIGHAFHFRNSGAQPASINVNGKTIKPNGMRFGYQAAFGMMLQLDFLEPGALRSARGQGMLDHVYLKAELSYTKIDSFGRRGYQFSPKDVMGSSLPLLWTFGLVFQLP